MKTDNRETNRYQFADFTLETETQTLSRQDEPIHLAKRPYELLLFLIENRERVVSRDELLDKFWDGHDVYDDVLRKTVGAIRHALNDTKKPARLIETRRGSGFRFIGKVVEIPNSKFQIPDLKPQISDSKFQNFRFQICRSNQRKLLRNRRPLRRRKYLFGIRGLF